MRELPHVLGIVLAGIGLLGVGALVQVARLQTGVMQDPEQGLSGGVSNAWPDIRLMGVLNRIALCYLFASLLFLNFNVRGIVVWRREKN